MFLHQTLDFLGERFSLHPPCYPDHVLPVGAFLYVTLEQDLVVLVGQNDNPYQVIYHDLQVFYLAYYLDMLAGMLPLPLPTP